MKLKDTLGLLRKTRPRMSIDLAKYLYDKPSDLNKRGDRIVMYVLIWSDDGRVSMHHTEFGKSRRMSAAEWAGWIKVNAPRILVDNVLPYVNRSFGSGWNIDRVFGWHFTSPRKARK
jgi:hypothetical protein